MTTTTSSKRIARWTNAGTHGGPRTVDVYLRADGRYDLVIHFGGSLIRSETLDHMPTEADAKIDGRLRKVAL